MASCVIKRFLFEKTGFIHFILALLERIVIIVIDFLVVFFLEDGRVLNDDPVDGVAAQLFLGVDSSHFLEPLLVELLKVGDDSLPLSLHIRTDGLTFAIVGQV
jgi:hypothetical protein